MEYLGIIFLILLWSVFGFLIFSIIASKKIDKLQDHPALFFMLLFLLGPVCWIMGLIFIDVRRKKCLQKH